MGAGAGAERRGPVGAWVAAVEDGASRFAVTYDVRRDGSVRVVQDITWQFPAGEERHGIYRTVKTRAGYAPNPDQVRVYELSDLEVTSPTGASTQVSVSQQGAEQKVRIGSPDEVVTGTQRYRVAYTLAHVVNDIGDGTAELYLDQISPSNTSFYEAVTASVRGPAPATRTACYTGPFGAITPCRSAPGNPSTFSAPAVAPYEGMSIVASYPRTAFADLTPDLRAGGVEDAVTEDPDTEEDVAAPAMAPGLERTVAVGAVTLGVLLPLLSAALMGLLVWSRGRDEEYVGLTPGLTPGAAPGMSADAAVARRTREPAVAVQFAPPVGVQPGLLGTVIDEDAGLVDVSATIVDLAVRGHLTIARVEREGTEGGEDWELRRAASPPTGRALAPYEQTLLDGLFARGERTRLSWLRGEFATTAAAVQRELYDEVVARGWFRRSPERQRAAFRVAGGALMGVAVVGGLVALPAFWSDLGGAAGAGLAALVAVVGVFASGLIIRSLGRRMAARTAEGTAVLAQARGFEQYLATAEAGQIRFEEAQDIFSRYLPYAIAFGLAERWATLFTEVTAAAQAAGVVLQQPTWWAGHWHSSDFGALAYGADSFATSAVGSFTSTPGSSGSSGLTASSSGFSGGFGGGFSGGGGTGSGGGSW